MRYGLHGGNIRPWARFGLDLGERTLAEALREAGYATHLVGKWHLGSHERAYLPTERGFDHHYGSYTGQIDHFTHRREGGLDWHRDGQPSHDEGYATELIAREAVATIAAHDPQTPLFLFVSFTAPHLPLQAPAAYLQRVADLAPERRAHAAMVAALDDALGEIVDALESADLREHTLVIFASDNGGIPREGSSNSPLRGGKHDYLEGGVRACGLASWPGVIEPGGTIEETVHFVDLLPTFVSLAGGNLESGRPLDGVNAWPAIGAGVRVREELLLGVDPQGGALRRGRWKIHATFDAKGNTETTTLFDVIADPGERSNLSLEQPERLQAMLKDLQRYGEQAVMPLHAGPRPSDFSAPSVWGPAD